MKKRAAIVLGVGSDGTSLFAGVLYRLGFYLGEDKDLISANVQNPRGFYEHKELPRLNRLIMKEHGLGEYNSAHIVEQTAHSDLIEEFFYLTFKNRNRIALKDPRFCVTLPVWASVIEKRYELKLILVHRNHSDHLTAITKSGKTTKERAIEYIEGRRRLQLELGARYKGFDMSYDSFVDDPEGETRSLVQRLETRLLKDQMREIERFVL